MEEAHTKAQRPQRDEGKPKLTNNYIFVEFVALAHSRKLPWGLTLPSATLSQGRGNAQRRMRGAGLRLPSPAGRRCRAAADEGGAGPRPVPPLTRPSARPRKRGSPLSRRERERAAADEGHSCRRDCSLIRLQGLRSHLVGASISAIPSTTPSRPWRTSSLEIRTTRSPRPSEGGR